MPNGKIAAKSRNGVRPVSYRYARREQVRMNHAEHAGTDQNSEPPVSSHLPGGPGTLPANIVRLFAPADPRARMASDWAEAMRLAGTPIRPPCE